MLFLGNNYYAGIGSRDTPLHIQRRMTYISGLLYDYGLILRSGNARGADKAFQNGCPSEAQEIFTRKDACPVSEQIASTHHPKWSACDEHARNLHARNVKIILGEDMNTPVDFVVCWTVNGEAKGGTGLGIRIAKDKKIPIYNLFKDDDYHELIFQISMWDDAA